jgi:hypothetical protein
MELHHSVKHELQKGQRQDDKPAFASVPLKFEKE